MSNNYVQMTFWDVQHGSATHITSPNGRTIVIDLGDADAVGGGRFSPLLALRHLQNVSSIDCLIITHPHRDHVDDIEHVSAFSPKVLIRPGWLSEADIRGGNKPQDNTKITQYIQLSNSYSSPVPKAYDTYASENWGGLSVRTYTSPNVPRINLNNHSIVTFISYAGITVLIPGDNEAPSWNALLEQSAFITELPKVNVLLAPHHGRDAGFCQNLFDAGLRPQLTVISDDQAGSTSVTPAYSGRTTGWTVYRPDGSYETRKCVTTRCDGTINVQIGQNHTGGNYLYVVTEK